MKEKHFCRCCLTEECYKDMANIYYIENKRENYFDMLVNIFNIKISNKDTQRCLICEDCVSKLRDAAAFKAQVLNTQEALQQNLGWDGSTQTDSLTNPVMETQYGYDCSDEFYDTLSDKFKDSDFVWDDSTSNTQQKAQTLVITLESRQEKPEKNTEHIISNTNNTKLDQENENISSISTELDGASKNSVANVKNTFNYKGGLNTYDTENTARSYLRRNCSKKINDTDIIENNSASCSNMSSAENKNKKLNTQSKLLNNISGTAKKSKGKDRSHEATTQDVSHTKLMSKYKRENTLKLVQNSNLCLFRSLQNKYGCMYCSAKFADIIQLRNHSFTHINPKSVIRKLNCLRGLSCRNAEISDLKCNTCHQNCTDFNELINHLINEHEISFRGTEHYLVPYKLQNGFQCVLCDSKFNSYLRLSIHMNSHYTNNVCEICGQSFINRLGLRTHVHAMHREKKCSHCTAVFLTNALKTKHLRQFHNFQNWKRYCNLCDKPFRYTYLLEEHKIQDHGFERQIACCLECGKTFISATNLKIHCRSVHVKERNHPCSKCGMRFFTKCDKKRHEKTHEDIRSFSCSYCEAKFKSKDSCRRHLKRQHGHVLCET